MAAHGLENGQGDRRRSERGVCRWRDPCGSVDAFAAGPAGRGLAAPSAGGWALVFLSRDGRGVRPCRVWCFTRDGQRHVERGEDEGKRLAGKACRLQG